MSKKMTREVEEWIRNIARDEIRGILHSEGLPAKQPEKDEEERQIRRLTRELTETGRVLEISTYQRLVSRGWNADINETHWDIETRPEVPPWKEYRDDVMSGRLTKEEREVDVVADKKVKPAHRSIVSSEVKAVIECKYRSRENWAFFMEPLTSPRAREGIVNAGGPRGLRGDISLFASLEVEGTRINTKIQEVMGGRARGRLLAASHHSSIHLTDIAVKGYTVFSDTDSLRSGCSKILDVALFERAVYESLLFVGSVQEISEGTRFHWKIYPVIVFDGPLWRVDVRNGEVNVSPLSSVTYAVLRKNCEYFVDIVRWDCFDSYLGLLDNELKRIGRIGASSL